MLERPKYSVVIPVHNEAENIVPLLEEIERFFAEGPPYEVICVDDGSSDQTLSELRSCGQRMTRLRIMVHPSCRGQSAALKTGVEAAGAPWIITIDGDGQDDPASIERLIAAKDGCPHELVLVCGQRVRRQDSLSRRISSWLARAGRALLLGDLTPDAGCGLKLFPRAVFQDLPYFDHMHRFLPALMRRAGLEVISVPVNHRPRRKGSSHYGIGNRLWGTLADLLGVMWLQRRIKLRNVKETKGED